MITFYQVSVAIQFWWYHMQVMVMVMVIDKYLFELWVYKGNAESIRII